MKGFIRGVVVGIVMTIAVQNVPSFINNVYVAAKINYYTEQAAALESVGAQDSTHPAHAEYVQYVSTINYLNNK